ncbi:hypothetical protein Hanom_Chr06g00523491 [Helianthus anomalus]
MVRGMEPESMLPNKTRVSRLVRSVMFSGMPSEIEFPGRERCCRYRAVVMSAGIPLLRLLKPRLRTWGMSPVKWFKEKPRMSKPRERVQMEGGWCRKGCC